MANNKTTGLLLLGGATALFVLPKLVGASGETKSSQSGGSGLVLIPSGFGTGEVSAPLTASNLPNVIINEASLPSYNPPAEEQITETKKTTSSAPASIKINNGVGSYAEYKSLPEDSPVKKAMELKYPEISLGKGKGSIVPTYGLGAGGTATYIPPKVNFNLTSSTTKKEASASSEKKSWWKFL